MGGWRLEVDSPDLGMFFRTMNLAPAHNVSMSSVRLFKIQIYSHLQSQMIGQPVLIGGTMGTCSYVLVGTDYGMRNTFGSTCHGAGRALSRNVSRNKLDYGDVLKRLENKGISVRVASPKLIMEEAPESYKDVTEVVDTCHQAGISKKVIKLRPIAVVKG